MAEKTADELLLSDANDVYALNTKMILNAQNRRLDVAKEFARRIRRLRNPNPAFYRNASQILALDSNQPPAYNGPVGPK
jgi:hypothetical protein